MIKEEAALSDFISDYSEGVRDGASTQTRSISRFFRLTLFMCLLQGFSERQFFDMLLFGHLWRQPVNSLSSELMLFSQHFVGCIGFMFWSVLCNYLKPQIVLSLSFMVLGLVSVFQPFASSFLPLLICRYLLSFSYGALEPSVQVISTSCRLRNSDMAKMFGGVSCYKSFGSFVSIAISTMIYLNGDSQVITTYSHAVWTVTGGISILISALVIISMYVEYRVSSQNSVFEMVLQESYVSSSIDDMKRDKVTIYCIYLGVFASGLLANVISEIYSFYQITSSFSFEWYDGQDTHILSLNLTYYALSSVVFLLGSAIGSLTFGIIYGYVYGLAKRAKERFEIDSVTGLGRKGSINILCLTSASVVSSLLLSLLLVHFVFEIPNMAKLVVVDIVPNSLNLYWIFAHLIAVFLVGALLLPAIEIIPRFQLVTLSQPGNSVISYGLYLMITGLFSDPSLYKHVRLFSKDNNYKVSTSNHLSFNVIPSIFHIPIKALFSGQVISKLKEMDSPFNYIYFQELHMASSIYSILLYTFVSLVITSLLLIKFTVCRSRKNANLD